MYIHGEGYQAFQLGDVAQARRVLLGEGLAFEFRKHRDQAPPQPANRGFTQLPN